MAKTIRQIADEIGVSKTAINKKIKNLGLQTDLRKDKNRIVVDEETEKLITAELERRYFTPDIEKIYSVKEKFGYLYFDALTSAGKMAITVFNPFSPPSIKAS